MTYRFVPHTADVKVAIEAPELEGVFRDGLAVVRALAVGVSEVRAETSRPVTLTAPDPAELLFAFLKEVLFWFAVDAFVPATLQVETLSPTQLEGTVDGERFDPTRHEAQPEVKAVTRHQLIVREQDGHWRADVVFDL